MQSRDYQNYSACGAPLSLALWPVMQDCKGHLSGEDRGKDKEIDTCHETVEL